MQSPLPESPVPAAPLDAERLYARIAWRLLPLLFLCYILAYLDRVNVGFARLQMNADLGFSDTVYGIGAGVFFIGYFLFEVPSNLLLVRIGARIWIARIMITWGLTSAAMMFTTNATTFYVLRFLLGVAEAGFFPGIIFYLTYWYTRARRAQMIAAFMTAVPLAGVVGGPISGAILATMDDTLGLQAWQWLFLLEGLPSVAMGVVVLAWLPNGPRDAAWLSPRERDYLRAELEEDERSKIAAGEGRDRLTDAFRSPRVWLMCGVYFGLIMGAYGVSFWLPQFVAETVTGDPWHVGLISAVPWAIAAVAMVLNGRHSDRVGERRWHIAVPCLVAGAAFALCGLAELRGVLSIVVLTIATAGVMCGLSCFWSLPTTIFSAAAAAAAVAWINSLGNIAGYVSPALVGGLRDSYAGDMARPFLLWAVSACASAALVLIVIRMRAEAGRTRRQGP